MSDSEMTHRTRSHDRRSRYTTDPDRADSESGGSGAPSPPPTMRRHAPRGPLRLSDARGGSYISSAVMGGSRGRDEGGYYSGQDRGGGEGGVMKSGSFSGRDTERLRDSALERSARRHERHHRGAGERGQRHQRIGGVECCLTIKWNLCSHILTN